MGIIESIVLGIVQGLTEFLPVSSSGHLVLLQNVFGIAEPQLFFDVMLHVGTLIAVAVVLWKDLLAIFKNPFGKMTRLLVAATIPAIVAAVLFKDVFEEAFGGKYLGFGFIVTGILLTLAESIYAYVSTRKINNITYKDAVVMGVLQAFAIFPAVSRSGSTISGGLFMGMERRQTAKFAFLMSIPAILGSAVMEGIDAAKAGFAGIDWLGTALGVAFAFAAGFVAVKFMIALISQKRLFGFAIYTFILGGLVVLDQFVFNVFFTRPF